MNELEKEEHASLDEALAHLPNLLANRLKLLDAREEELKKSFERLEQEKATLGCGDASDVIHLNVGGTLTATLRSTLTYVEDSMLAARFSGRWDESIAKDRDGNFFIDQPIELFLPMLNFIRSKQSQTGLVTDHPSPALSDFADNERKYNDFKQMVEYFGVTPKIFPVELVDYTASDPERLASSLSCSSLQVATNEWMICGLVPSGHARKITGFEVKVGEAVNLQIGWVKNSIQTNTDVSSHRCCLELDFARGGIHCVDGEFVSVINTLKNGTFVQCKNFGKEWFIDGTSFTGNWNITWGAYVPAISGKGEWTITSVELEP